MKSRYFLLSVLLFNVQFLYSQETKPENIHLYIDCQQTYCDINYIKNEINYINYVNDRFQADVYILITSQGTGSGGRIYKLQVTGQGPFEGIADTLSYIRPAGATDDEDRRLAVQTIGAAILPYMLKTEKSRDMTVTFTPLSDSSDTDRPEKDPWNYWVMSINMNGNFDGDKNYSSKYFSAGFSASRVTDELKINFGVDASRNSNRYGSGADEYKFTNRNYDFDNLTVWSLSPKLSAGGSVSVEQSDYSNYKLSLYVTPAIEYDFFPYSEASNRSLRIMYKAGPRYFRYYEETVYLKTKELRFQESLSLSLRFNQKWGQVSGSTSFSHFFQDFSKNRLSFNANADLRLFKGLFLDINGNYSFSHDQLNIVKGDVTDQDLLTRRRQLDSNFNFYFSYGIRYRFGSLFNNVVNPRF